MINTSREGSKYSQRSNKGTKASLSFQQSDVDLELEGLVEGVTEELVRVFYGCSCRLPARLYKPVTLPLHCLSKRKGTVTLLSVYRCDNNYSYLHVTMA